MAEEMYLPYDRGGTLRKVDAFPAGYSNDGIFGYTIGGVNYIRTKKGPLNSMEVGIYANGSDMTARINAVAAHPWVKKIEFSEDAGGDIVCTGNVNGQGKVFRIHPGTKLRTNGSGVINNFIIEAGDTAQIFSGTKNVNPAGCSKPYSTPNWYGANNGTDENGACINKAIYVVAKNTAMPRRIVLCDRTYNISSPGVLIINVNDTNNYDQISVELYGSDISALSGQSTTLNFSNPNAFGIGIQLGKGVVIRGLKIQGPFVKDWGTDMKGFVETKLADYVTGTGCRDTRYSPCCGINIDPFCGAAPADGGYPDLTAYYQGGITVDGSTNIKVVNCTINHWVLGIGTSINGTTLNADSCVVEHCSVEHNKVNFAYGHDQTKRCLIADIMVSDSVHTFVTTRMYGTGTGAPPNIHGVTIASKCNQIFDVDTAGRFGFECHGLYAESCYRIGMVVGKPTVIKNLIFNASLAEYPNILGAPDLYGQFSNVTFEGGLIRNYDNLNNKRMHFFATNCTFKKVQFDTPPLLQEGGNNKFEDCSCDSGHTITSGDFVVPSNDEIANYLQHGRIRVEITQNFTYCQSETEYNFSRDYESRIVATNGAVLTVDATHRTATFPTGDEVNYAQVGDYITKQTPGNFFDYASPMPFEVVGRIVSMSGGVTTLADVPVEIVSGTYNLYMSFYRTIGIPFVADTNSSATLTNVESSGYSLPAQGQRISQFQFGISGNVYVKAVNAGLKTITLSSTAFVSFKNVEFNNYGERTIKGALQPTHPNYVNATAIIFTGNRFLGYKVDDDNVMFPQEFICSNPGFISAAAAAVVGSTRIAKWKWEKIDSFTLSANGTRTIEAGAKAEQIHLTPTADMTVSIGTTPGGIDVADSLPLTADVTEPQFANLTADTAKTLYFTGVSGGTLNIKIFKKSL